VRIVVIADTHLQRGLTTRLARPLLDDIERCDLVLHAGDVTTPETLHELSSLSPVRCVLGNNDDLLAGSVPKELVFDIEGVTVAMIHDSGQRIGREARMLRHFPAADLVVYGHSHIPSDIEGFNSQRLFNPGSPTQRRAQPACTYGVLEIRDGVVVTHEVLALTP